MKSQHRYHAYTKNSQTLLVGWSIIRPEVTLQFIKYWCDGADFAVWFARLPTTMKAGQQT